MNPDDCSYCQEWDGVAETLPFDFCQAIFQRAAGGREMKFGRWLEDRDGNDLQEEWCTDCVRYARRNRKARRVGGWNDSFEVDIANRCLGCGVLLDHTLTEYGACRELGLEDGSLEARFYGAAFGDDALILANLDQWLSYWNQQFQERYSQVAYVTLWEMQHGRTRVWGKKNEKKLP